jgi:UDP-2,3-diacylglucosamine pyrophosphatase LpxH
MPGPVGDFVEANLARLYAAAPVLPLADEARIVVVSDLHLGDGGRRDDFLANAGLLSAALARHYLPRGFDLVLNGDIEELQRFPLSAVLRRWGELEDLFAEFARRTALHRIVGNHDAPLVRAGAERVPGRPLAALRLRRGAEELFLYHGHQATLFFERFNGLSGFLLRTVANALRIPNFPVTPESRRRFLTESRAYRFASDRRLVSIIGHTHRPLFESASKIDNLKFRIEQLCRAYPRSLPRARAAIETAVLSYRRELGHLWQKDRAEGLRGSLYGGEPCAPCLFNSGCAIGKRGLTAIEIAEGTISLVHWFDDRVSTRHLQRTGASPERLDDGPYWRTVLKSDRLDYVFGRIRLLAGDVIGPGRRGGRRRCMGRLPKKDAWTTLRR